MTSTSIFLCTVIFVVRSSIYNTYHLAYLSDTQAKNRNLKAIRVRKKKVKKGLLKTTDSACSRSIKSNNKIIIHQKLEAFIFNKNLKPINFYFEILQIEHRLPKFKTLTTSYLFYSSKRRNKYILLTKASSVNVRTHTHTHINTITRIHKQMNICKSIVSVCVCKSIVSVCVCVYLHIHIHT